jgi:hypothetical protein
VILPTDKGNASLVMLSKAKMNLILSDLAYRQLKTDPMKKIERKNHLVN